jgi:glycosyltransferase involved in cell wall biosynthesis
MELGISERVHFVGEARNVEEYLADADVYLSASHREGLPLSMLEAMASELPIISTDVGGCSDIVDGNGILIPDDDIDAMYNAMMYLIENEDVRRGYGRQSLVNVAPYDVRTTTLKYQEIYTLEAGKLK